jgi:hypothetical protein
MFSFLPQVMLRTQDINNGNRNKKNGYYLPTYPLTGLNRNRQSTIKKKLNYASRRTIFRPERDEQTEEWRKLHDNELRNLYSPRDCYSNETKNGKIGGICRTTVETSKDLMEESICGTV